MIVGHPKCFNSMKNLHLEHPEDTILTGDLSCLDWFVDPDSFISTKMDGAPAIVWGTNPANGKFFVGTKAVFNKVKIRIAHSHHEIDQFYEGKVARILHTCFDCLPRTQSIIQGDFIGYGGSDTFRPNTITYVFPEIITQDVIIAPHTIYNALDDLRDAYAFPLTSKLISTKQCLFVQPEAELYPFREDLYDVCKFAKQMSTLCEFVNKTKAAKIKKAINDRIREGKFVNENEIAEKCEGYSGASLAGVARAAASHALERAVDEFSQNLNGSTTAPTNIMDCLVTPDDFSEAVDDVLQSMGNTDFSDEEDVEEEEKEDSDSKEADEEEDPISPE